jgi:hypothetical protein
MECSINIRLNYLHMEVNKLGFKTTGTRMLLLLHGLVPKILLIVAKIHSLESKSLDFILAFPQADLDIPVYMELPAGVNPVDVYDGDQRKYILKLNKSFYGLKQDGYNWFKNLHKELITHALIQSQLDKCIFCHKDCIVLTCIDDCIILGKDMAIIDVVITLFQEGHKEFDLVDQGSIDKHLGL